MNEYKVAEEELIAHRRAQTERRAEEMKRIRAERDAREAIANEVRDRIGEAEWNKIVRRSRDESIRRGEVLDFYRDDAGAAQFRFRKETEEERDERISDWVEDNI